MKLHPKYRNLVTTFGVVVLLPLACERADHDVQRGLSSGDGDGSMGGASGGVMNVGDGDGDEGNTGGSSAGGTIFVPPSTGGVSEIPELPNAYLEVCSSALGGASGMGGNPAVGDASGSLLIDDFEDMNSRVYGNGLSGRWETHNDAAESGVQTPLGGFRYPDADWAELAFDVGFDGSSASLHMTGTGFDAWGSGQALYLAQGPDEYACLFDGSAYAGVTFMARGHVTPDSDDVLEQPRPEELGKMRVKIPDLDVMSNGGDELEPGATAGGRCDEINYACWDSPLTRIELNENPECWQRYVLPFDEMEADAWSKWKGNDGSKDVRALDPDEMFQIVFEVSELQTYEIWLDDISFYTADDVPAEGTFCP